MDEIEPPRDRPLPLPSVRTNVFDPPPELGRFCREEPLRRLVYPDSHVGWLVTSHELARAVLGDARFSARSDLKRAPIPRPGAESFYGQPPAPGWFVDMDAPDHTRYRRVLAGQFTVRRVNALRPQIEEVVKERLDAMQDAGGPLDLVEWFALPVPSLTICELLGVPYADREEFQKNSATTFSLRATADEGAKAMQTLTEYLSALVRERRVRPTEDLLGALVASGDLSDAEIAGAGVLLLTAGHETVASMLGLGTLALLQHPEQLGRLRADPTLVEATVEELLRYLTIFQFGVPRSPKEDVEIGGVCIRKGESVTVSLPAANRDPAKFAAGDVLDIERSAKGHVAFGYGVHQCIGQNLARVEMQIGYAALFQRFPELRLAVPLDQVPFGNDMGFYGVHELPVEL